MSSTNSTKHLSTSKINNNFCHYKKLSYVPSISVNRSSSLPKISEYVKIDDKFTNLRVKNFHLSLNELDNISEKIFNKPLFTNKYSTPKFKKLNPIRKTTNENKSSQTNLLRTKSEITYSNSCKTLISFKNRNLNQFQKYNNATLWLNNNNEKFRYKIEERPNILMKSVVKYLELQKLSAFSVKYYIPKTIRRNRSFYSYQK